LVVDFARVMGADSETGGALLASARVGSLRAPHLTAHVAERDHIDPRFARALWDPGSEPAAGFLAWPGWTGGSQVGLPLGRRVTARAGAEYDFDADELVAALAAVELHDPCGCLVMRLNGSHRIGRPGADVWLSVDLPLDR
jgi:hypothetical protein